VTGHRADRGFEFLHEIPKRESSAWLHHVYKSLTLVLRECPAPMSRSPRLEEPSVAVVERMDCTAGKEGGGLWIGILGPLQVVSDGAEARALPAAQRAVLGLLALACGSPVRRESFVDAVWGGKPPPSASGLIQTYVSRLRSMLGALLESDRVVIPAIAGAGYRLLLAEEQLDVLVFRRAAHDARRALAAGDAGEACHAFARAIGLWRGEPLADVDALREHPAVTAQAQERVQVVLEYADAALAAGWPDRVLPHLQTLATRNPLDEASHARLLMVLAGTGRQAEALTVFEELRRRLDEELGVLPGPELREAHARVLRQEIPARAQRNGRVYEWQPVFQLPAAPADYTGRDAETEELIAAVCPSRDHPGVPIVAISGHPGVGKTSLAMYAAHKVRARFPDGQLWVPLAGASARPRDPGDVLGELLRALGIPGSAIPDEPAERAGCYRSRLAGRKVLVVADDAATAAQIRPLVPGTAGCALVVTSRARLEGLDGAHLMPLDVMSTDDAVGLLGQIVGESRVAAELDDASSLVEACGALPLALRIAGAKLAARPSWPLSAMVRKITSNHDRLRELQAGDRSVRASIAPSYESLPEPHRRAFRLLALLGPVDFAEWVVGVLLGEPVAADVISELTSRSLLTTLGADATDELRYRLHDLLRDYAAERLVEEPIADQDAARERLLKAWVQLAQLADSQLPPEPFFPPPVRVPAPGIVPGKEAERLTADPVAWFTAERVNSLAAIEQACQQGRLDLARQLASHQCAFHHLQDRHDDSELIWRMIAERAEKSVDPVSSNYARLRVGASMVERGRVAEALPIFGQCVHMSESIEEYETLALALYWSSACASYLLDFEPARLHAERGVSAARRAGSRLAELMKLRALSEALAKSGSPVRAIDASEQAVAIASDLGVASYELAALHNLAYATLLSGRHHRAMELFLRRLDLSRELGDTRGDALSLALLGDVHLAMGEHEVAADYLHQALPLLRAHHAGLHCAMCLRKLGCAYEALARHAEAVGYLRESLLLYQQFRVPGQVERARRALYRCQAAIAAAS